MDYKIKSAIILAAGRGTRMCELTEKIPKSLLQVKGDVLIERLIEQLQAKGIDDIYVVTGYKHWLFDYLNEKYGVSVVYNKKWFCTNNIVSFIKGYEERCKISSTFGTILLDADVYIENENVFVQNITQSGYYLEYSEDANKCTKEWVANILGAANKRIIGISADGSKTSGHVLRSISYWTPSDMHKLYTYAKNAISSGNNLQCYIDNIPFFICPTCFSLKAYIFDENSVLEVDTVEDYMDANKEKQNEKNS